MQAHAQNKQRFIEEFFRQPMLEMARLAPYTNDLLGHQIPLVPGKYLPSYSLDGANPFSSPLGPTRNYSGYFAPNEAGCNLWYLADFTTS